MKEGPPPTLLLFIPALFAIGGGAGIAQLIAGFFHGNFILSPLIVGIPAGLGLLSLREGARKWVGVCAALCALWILTIAGIAYRTNGQLAATFHDPFETTARIIVFVISGGIWLTLRSKRMQTWFSPEGSNYAYANKWWHTLILLGMFLGALWEIKDVQVRRSIAKVYEVDTTFFGIDSETGKILKSLGTSSPSPSKISTSFVRIDMIFNATSDCVDINAKGQTNEPVKITFTSKGKKPVDYWLTPESPREVTLTFEPDPDFTSK